LSGPGPLGCGWLGTWPRPGSPARCWSGADESNLTRAFAVHARTLEVLDARGLADDLIATGTTVRAAALREALTAWCGEPVRALGPAPG
jgi:hypothetical protein